MTISRLGWPAFMSMLNSAVKAWHAASSPRSRIMRAAKASSAFTSMPSTRRIFYRKCGWTLAERVASGHAALVLMTRDL
jgi:hypothetical protein